MQSLQVRPTIEGTLRPSDALEAIPVVVVGMVDQAGRRGSPEPYSQLVKQETFYCETTTGNNITLIDDIAAWLGKPNPSTSADSELGEYEVEVDYVYDDVNGDASVGDTFNITIYYGGTARVQSSRTFTSWLTASRGQRFPVGNLLGTAQSLVVDFNNWAAAETHRAHLVVRGWRSPCKAARTDATS